MASSADVETRLRESFGFGEFRPGQRELVETVLAGRDALGILPTGGGKSLTYQSATLLDGLTVVVSPLIALTIRAEGSDGPRVSAREERGTQQLGIQVDGCPHA